jgi:hypothetical protein
MSHPVCRSARNLEEALLVVPTALHGSRPRAATGWLPLEARG